jgi:hypothetical protein
MKNYDANWLPLDELDEGFQQYREAEKILAAEDCESRHLLGGLNHIEIGPTTVRYIDRGMNGRRRNLSVNILTRKVRNF